MKTLFALAALVAVSACAPSSAFDRAYLSQELNGYSGARLREGGASGFQLPPQVKLDDGLTEDEAVAIALWNNGQFQADLGALGLARGDLVEAGMIRNPFLTLLLPLGPKQLEFTAGLPLESLWQRPKKIEAAQAEVERVAVSLVQTGLDLIRTVKVTVADAALSRERLRLAKEAAELRARIAAVSEARLRAGDASELELASIRVEKRRAEHDVKRLEIEATLAADRLDTLLGLENGERPAVVLVELAQRPEGDLPAELRDGLALRPDLRAAELAVQAARHRVSAAFAASFPQAALIADANGAGLQGFEAGPGLQVELPVFSVNQGQRARTEADYHRLAWAYVATRQRVALEIRNAHGRLEAARQALTLLRAEVLPDLDSATRRAEKAFAGGEASYLMVLETARQQLEAHLREVELETELRRAAAELDRSVGRKRVHAN